MTDLAAVVRYIAEGFGGSWTPTRVAVWMDQLKESKLPVQTLEAAAKRFVAHSKFPVVAEFLEIARGIFHDRIMRERSNEVFRIEEGAASEEVARARIAEIRELFSWHHHRPRDQAG